ncbi:Amine sulfotransferase [Takifugu flavidus]|uniref:Sulfotransferase n=1 Tax=Takifugu flavidus TaxID=433684 RepID=A0A5C6PHB7_9TELE|nr:Amine sulfotransferase [Takifugu flavidus]
MDSLDMITSDLFRYKGMNFPVNEKLRPKDIDALKDFEIRPTDVFIITFPKSGTVWMQQILSQIMEASHPGWAEDVTNRAKIPYLEGRTVDDPFRDRKEPRVLYTHLFLELLPHGVKEKQIKVVYVLRNPKDVLVSLYHFAHSWVLMDSPTSFEVFFKQFMDGKQFVGSWFAHVKQYVAAQEQLKIHIVRFQVENP